MSPTYAQILKDGAKPVQTRTSVTDASKPPKEVQTKISSTQILQREDAVGCATHSVHERKLVKLTCGHLYCKDCLHQILDMESKYMHPDAQEEKTVLADAPEKHKAEAKAPSDLPQLASPIEVPQTSPERHDMGPTAPSDPTQAHEIPPPTAPEKPGKKAVSDFFSKISAEVMSSIICADPFCSCRVPQKCIRGRWATCHLCSQRTCLVCNLLEKSHINAGWQICPDGAKAMGLERHAKAWGWKRCDQCHRFLVKDATGKDLPCFHGEDAEDDEA